jgi:hypothetical protein
MYAVCFEYNENCLTTTSSTSSTSDGDFALVALLITNSQSDGVSALGKCMIHPLGIGFDSAESVLNSPLCAITSKSGGNLCNKSTTETK